MIPCEIFEYRIECVMDEYKSDINMPLHISDRMSVSLPVTSTRPVC